MDKQKFRLSEKNSVPLVSVIIIFLNAESFIEEAIQSVLSQTFSNWELLVVDDGSTDESTDIACRFAQQYSNRIRYLEHTGHRNLGMSASRNLGIQNSKGDLIAFLDADDTWFARTLEEQVAVLESHPEVAMVYGPLFWWYSWTDLPEDQKRDRIENLGVPSDSVIEPPKLLPLFLLDKAAVPSGILVRRQAIDRVGGFEEAFRGEYEDQVFCAKICLHAPVFASSHCWYRYRQHPNSSVAMGQITGQTYKFRMKFLNWLEQYLQNQKINDPRVWWALKYELAPFRQPWLFRVSKNAQNLVWRLNALVRKGLHRFPAHHVSKQTPKIWNIAETKQDDKR